MRTRLISLGKAAVAPVLAVLFCFLPASAVAAVDDNEAVALITKFYQNFFHEKSDYASEDATIDALCSDNLKKKLRDAYEYDYEGSVAPYATWLFTTGAQDGPGDSKFVGAAAVGGGEYRADYYDMGIKAASVLKVVETAGGLKIDDVKCVEGGEADGDDGGIVDEPAPVSDGRVYKLLLADNTNLKEPAWRDRLVPLVGEAGYKFMCAQYMGTATQQGRDGVGNLNFYFEGHTKENWVDGYKLNFCYGGTFDSLTVVLIRNGQEQRFDDFMTVGE